MIYVKSPTMVLNVFFFMYKIVLGKCNSLELNNKTNIYPINFTFYITNQAINKRAVMNFFGISI